MERAWVPDRVPAVRAGMFRQETIASTFEQFLKNDVRKTQSDRVLRRYSAFDESGITKTHRIRLSQHQSSYGKVGLNEDRCKAHQEKRGTASEMENGKTSCFSKKNGAAEGTRTPDPIITNDVLYQLSYSGILLLSRPERGPNRYIQQPKPP